MSDKPSLLGILHKALNAWVKQPNSSFMVYVMYYNAYKRGNFFEQPPGVTKYGVDIFGEHCQKCGTLYWWGFVDGSPVYTPYKCPVCFFRETWTELFLWIHTGNIDIENILRIKESVCDLAPTIPDDFCKKTQYSLRRRT